MALDLPSDCTPAAGTDQLAADVEQRAISDEQTERLVESMAVLNAYSDVQRPSEVRCTY